MHEKARFFLVCMFPFSFCLLDFTAQLFLKFSQKLILKTGFLKNTAEDLMAGTGFTVPYHRGSQYPIYLKLSSQIPPQLPTCKAKIFHLPLFSVFLKFSGSLPRWRWGLPVLHLLLTLSFLSLHFAKALQLPLLSFFSPSHFASLCSSWTDWQKFFAGDI